MGSGTYRAKALDQLGLTDPKNPYGEKQADDDKQAADLGLDIASGEDQQLPSYTDGARAVLVATGLGDLYPNRVLCMLNSGRSKQAM
ncbi:MAG: hypothetical protein LBJ87_12355 [bacterium]|nr:hypothetical protein [bacterium]